MLKRLAEFIFEIIIILFYKTLDRLPVVLVSFVLGAMFTAAVLFFDIPLFVAFFSRQVGNILISVFSGVLVGVSVSVYLSYRQLVRDLIISSRKTIRSLVLISGELEALRETDIQFDARARMELLKLVHKVKENGYELVEYDVRYPKGMREEFREIKKDLLNIYLKIDMALSDKSVSMDLLEQVEEDIEGLMNEYMLKFQKKLRGFFVPRVADLKRSG
ncbi:hypothetical protein [Dethiobacter alkaliphilus]|uniref:hypothetical protein n=1 Tax=Dethiobacter alkaliphilus TaxID=427926 RepID=UPI0022268FE1|nr:hypothetical protein [Dethiobacter alkaliphilus]MCW3491312.1 hypothetical protein [Dethiobacter alkaliphilus]